MENQLHLMYENPLNPAEVLIRHFITWRALTSFVWDNEIKTLQVKNDNGDTIVSIRMFKQGIPERERFEIKYYSDHHVPQSLLSIFS